MSAKAATIGAQRSGVYRAPAQVETLRKQAGQAGLLWLELPLRSVASKAQFLAVCAKRLKLPAYFGRNWDALADCIRDFNWLNAKGYALHVSGSEKFAKAAPEEFQTALAVFAEAAEFWAGKGTPFVVLVDGASDLPAF